LSAPRLKPIGTLLSKLDPLLTRVNVAFGALFCVGLTVNFFVVAAHENVNWDEFGMLLRAALTLESDVLKGGGRPGLGTVVLMPFVAGCTNPVEVVEKTRWLWSVFSLGYVAAFCVLLRQLFAKRRNVFGRRFAWQDALLAGGLLCVMPLWLRWSVQIRTDQGALFFGLWASVALAASVRNPRLAALAGAGFVVAALFTQKAAYIAALGGTLCLGGQWLSNDLEWRRELRRAAWLFLGAALVVGVWTLYARSFSEPPKMATFAAGAKAFAFQERTLGYQLYGHLLEYLRPHIIITVIGMACSIFSRFSKRSLGKELGVGLAVLTLGVAIALFHRSTFAYFWMTIGLFAAAVPAIMMGPVRAALPTYLSSGLTAAAWLALLGAAREPAQRLFEDTRSHQSKTFDFINRNFAPDAVGFHPESATLCRQSRSEFTTYFSATIYSVFYARDTTEQSRLFIERFRKEPVMFIIDSYRLRKFPELVRRFWSEHYIPATPSISILGSPVGGEWPSKRVMDVFVAGEYQWSPTAGRGEIDVDGDVLSAGQRVHLEPGDHQISVSKGTSGYLHWAVTDPVPSRGRPFFDFVVVSELTGKVY
jgi:hypothetical protein